MYNMNKLMIQSIDGFCGDIGNLSLSSVTIHNLFKN
jgi:hypothetical protein